MKNKNLVIVSFAFILLLSVSIVSAGFFDWITGRAAGEGGGGGSCSGSGDNEYCNDISLESNCASPCTWNAEAVSRGGEHCINPKQPCPMRVGAGFASVAGAGTQVAIQSADATLGTVNAVVKDSTGNLRTVTVSANTQTKLPSGEVLKVGTIEQGGLFRRGAEVNIVVVPAGEGVGASVGGVAGTVTGAHTHLTDYRYLSAPLIKKTGTGFNSFSQTLKCDAFGLDYVVLGGGFQLLDLTGQSQASYDVLTNGPIDQHIYGVDIKDYSASVGEGKIFATCARLEQAIDSGEPHF